MADKNFIVKNGLEVGGQEVVSSSGVVTSAALGGQTLASTDSPTFNNLTLTNDIAVGGDLNLTGDLNITGDVNSLSVTDLDVTDQTITLGAGQVESASGGSGIVVDGSGASILWDETNTEWDFNNSINVTGTVVADGLTVDGNGSLLTFNNGSNPATISNTNGNITTDFDTTNLGRNYTIQANSINAFRIANGGDISFYEDTGTTAKLFWDASTERLGIGTTSPREALEVSGHIKTNYSGSISMDYTASTGDYWKGMTGVSFENSTARGLHIFNFDNDSNYGINFWVGTNASKVFAGRINEDAKFGIGTDSPGTYKLAVNSGTAGTSNAEAGIYATGQRNGVVWNLVSNNTANAADRGSGIKFQSGGFTTGAIITRSDATAASADAPGYMTFHTSTDGSEDLSERMRITSSGNLKFVSQTTNFESPGFTYHTNNYLYLRGGSAGLILSDDSGINTVQIIDGSAGYINFETGDGSSRMRINSSRIEIDPTNDRYKFTYDGTSFNEGLRMAPHSNEYSILTLGAGTGDSGSVDGQWTIARHPDADNNKFSIRHQSDTNAINILKSGNVGIGVDTPSYKLDITATIGDQSPLLRGTASNTSTSNFNWISEFLMPNLSGGHRVVHAIGTARSNGNAATIGFFEHASASGYNAFNVGLFGNNDILNVCYNGNVGIMTQTPDSTLTVNGTIECLKDDFNSSSEGGHLILRAPSSVSSSKRFNIDTFALSGASTMRFFSEDDSNGANGAVHMYIKANGYVGINTAPNYQLDVRGQNSGTNGHTAYIENNGGGGNGCTFSVQNTDGNHSWGVVQELRIQNGSGTDNPSILFSSGTESTNTWTVGYGYTDVNFRIKRDHGYHNGGWGTALFTMDRSGNVTIGGSLTENSDERLKENIVTIPNALDKVSQLRGVTFDWKERDDEGNVRSSMGLIAQEVEAVEGLEVLVTEVAKDGSPEMEEFQPKGVTYQNMVGLLIEAIKELKTENNDLKSRLDEAGL